MVKIELNFLPEKERMKTDVVFFFFRKYRRKIDEIKLKSCAGIAKPALCDNHC